MLDGAEVTAVRELRIAAPGDREGASAGRTARLGSVRGVAAGVALHSIRRP
jgi:hypothetical protein